MKSEVKDLFSMQSEIIDMKVEVSVSKAIDRVIVEMRSIRNELYTELHNFREEVNKRFSAIENRLSSLDNRLVAVETRLGMNHETRKEIRSRLIDYTFKAGWLMLGVVLTFMLIQVHVLIR